MPYYNDPYEDEIDRMRARRRRGGGSVNRNRNSNGNRSSNLGRSGNLNRNGEMDWSGGPNRNGNYNRRPRRPRNTEENYEDDFEILDMDGSDDPRYGEYGDEEYGEEVYEDDDYDEEYGQEAYESREYGRRPYRAEAYEDEPYGAAPSQKNLKKAKKGKKKKHRLLIPLVLALALLATGLFYVLRPGQSGYWTIVVYGVDSREGTVGKGTLADVQILCSVNRKTGEIRLASLFRDTYLRIDGDSDYDKINEAYFLGGREQAVYAIQDNLDLKVDDYAIFNWKAVADGINILGGIDLDITDSEFAYINSFITETVQSTGVGSYQLEHSGPNHLDGVQAVAYARLRLMDTDFNRTERQRKVLGLAMEKAKQADFNTLRTILGAVFPQISTSIGIDDLMSIAKDVKKYYIGQTSGFPFSHAEMSIGKKSCVIPTTLESNVVQLHAFLYDDTSFTPSGNVRQISAQIANDSGLGDPGKDTESGKNIGAEGNTGNAQGSASGGGNSGQSENAPPAGDNSGDSGDPGGSGDSGGTANGEPQETLAPEESTEAGENAGETSAGQESESGSEITGGENSENPGDEGTTDPNSPGNGTSGNGSTGSSDSSTGNSNSGNATGNSGNSTSGAGPGGSGQGTGSSSQRPLETEEEEENHSSSSGPVSAPGADSDSGSSTGGPGQAPAAGGPAGPGGASGQDNPASGVVSGPGN